METYGDSIGLQDVARVYGGTGEDNILIENSDHGAGDQVNVSDTFTGNVQAVFHNADGASFTEDQPPDWAHIVSGNAEHTGGGDNDVLHGGAGAQELNSGDGETVLVLNGVTSLTIEVQRYIAAESDPNDSPVQVGDYLDGNRVAPVSLDVLIEVCVNLSGSYV